ncbi:MAG: acyl-CoA dehydrogenase domain protein [Nevskia sp.]|nr:acyl-CoA dehydrogenase domain protein [Nevskia sp.]
MNFEDSAAEAAYRKQVSAWLAEHAPAWSTAGARRDSEAEIVRLARGWQACKAAAGYVGITWPCEVGGQGGNAIQQVIFSQEEARHRVATMPFQVGMGMCIPTVYSFASHAVAQRYVGPAMRGEEIWCQLFSEPAAGSDLAGIRTRALRDGDRWIVNGQKVWTSWAHHSDYGLLLVRSDAGLPKHKGLTMFYVDMRAPGVDVRQIRGMTGETDFNEVFFTDVVIPDSQRLGDVGQGWKVAMTTLMHERFAIGRPADAPSVDELVALARSVRSSEQTLLDNAAVREAIAGFYVRDAGLDFIRMRVQTSLSKGRAPGPEASVLKLVMAKTRQDIGAFAMDLLESGAIRDTDSTPLDGFRYYQLFAPGLRIAGGTDEILRNIIAERVLGLPPDLRVDRDLPFNALK